MSTSRLALAVTFTLAGAAGCSNGSSSRASKSASSDDAERPSDRSAARSASSSAGSTMASGTASPSGTASAPADGVSLDLAPHGLPLTLVVPKCADGAPPKVAGPMVKIADNAKDLILTCAISDHDALAGKQAFTLQLGLAKGKLDKADIEKDLNFTRFVSSDPKRLEWESTLFGQKQRDFLLRSTVAGVEYACFPQFSALDEALYRTELAACQSLAPSSKK